MEEQHAKTGGEAEDTDKEGCRSSGENGAMDSTGTMEERRKVLRS